MIRVGTSGYALKEWEGFFYPQDMEQHKFLDHYSYFFDCVELTSTYYHIPSPYISEDMVRKTPHHFIFCVRLPKECTHEVENYENVIDTFKKSIAPFQKGKRLGCLVAQFPYSFLPDEKSKEHLKKIALDFENVVVEMRNKEWLLEPNLDFLKEQKLGFVNLDMPDLPSLMPKTARVTSDIGYVRFHGRNKDQWFNKENFNLKYDYHYTKEQLQEWVEDIKELEKQVSIVYVFFNNFHYAYSAANAGLLKELLSLPGHKVVMQKEHDKKLSDF